MIHRPVMHYYVSLFDHWADRILNILWFHQSESEITSVSLIFVALVFCYLFYISDTEI